MSIIKLWYCQGRKSSGRPVAVEVDGKRVRYVRGIRKHLKDATISMRFMNASGRARRSGATTVLVIKTHD